jgi:hypothetical protein
VISRERLTAALWPREPQKLEIEGFTCAAGLEPERPLREAIRELQVEIRSFELDSDNDAGVIGSYWLSSREFLKFLKADF